MPLIPLDSTTAVVKSVEAAVVSGLVELERVTTVDIVLMDVVS